MAEIEARGDLRVDRLLLFVSFRNVPIGFVAGQGFDGDAYHESSIRLRRRVAAFRSGIARSTFRSRRRS